jgi:hypothetical protein
MEVVRDTFISIVDWFFGLIGDMLASLWSDPSYRAGFFACLVTLVVGGVLQRIIGRAIARVQIFFRPTPAPPRPGVGATPVSITGGCAEGAVVLVVAGIVAAALLYALVSSIGAAP